MSLCGDDGEDEDNSDVPHFSFLKIPPGLDLAGFTLSNMARVRPGFGIALM